MGAKLSSRQVEESPVLVGEGGIAQTCNQAVSYTLVNGELLATSNGTVALFSTSGDVPYAPFVATYPPEAITTTFTVDNTGSLIWTNDLFFNGNALVSLMPSTYPYRMNPNSSRDIEDNIFTYFV